MTDNPDHHLAGDFRLVTSPSAHTRSNSRGAPVPGRVPAFAGVAERE